RDELVAGAGVTRGDDVAVGELQHLGEVGARELEHLDAVVAGALADVLERHVERGREPVNVEVDVTDERPAVHLRLLEWSPWPLDGEAASESTATRRTDPRNGRRASGDRRVRSRGRRRAPARAWSRRRPRATAGRGGPRARRRGRPGGT